MSTPLSARSARADARLYPDDLTPAVQETLAILADLAFAYEAARERLAMWDGPDPVKAEIAADLAARHEAAKAPYERRLEALHARMREVATPAPLH
jgi:hypothetical protein